MSDWREDMMAALQSGRADYMKAMLARVPQDLMQQVLPAISALATSFAKRGELDLAAMYLDQLVQIDPSTPTWWAERATLHLQRGDASHALSDAQHLATLQPDDPRTLRLQGDVYTAQGDRARAQSAYSAALAMAPDDASTREALERVSQKEASPPLAPVVFDPALFAQTPPLDTGDAMAEGLVRHLQRYGQQQAVRSTIDRLRDSEWVSEWQRALLVCRDAAVVLHGSELGVLAVFALQAGARQVTVVSTDALDRRIAAGLVQKHRLMQWRDANAAQIEQMDAAQRQVSFEAFNASIAFVGADDLDDVACDWLVFAALDHSLLGSGLAAALAPWRDRRRRPQLLPSHATVSAQVVRWTYRGVDVDLTPLNAMRWSPAAEPLDLPEGAWSVLTEVASFDEIDLWELSSDTCTATLQAREAGTIGAVLWWYALRLGDRTLASGPPGERTVGGLRPALQYLDPTPVHPGDAIKLQRILRPTRIDFELDVPRQNKRHARLPNWYVPMLLDTQRNAAYRRMFDGLQPSELVLEIGAGCGLLSMLAADAGARTIIGCEIDSSIHAVGSEVISRNGRADRITLLHKDCRELQLGVDLPVRADVVVFELFDCGLIGEGVLHFLAHVRDALAHAGTRYLPMAARVRGQIVEHRIERAGDVDLKLLNAFCFTPSYLNVDVRRLDYRALSAPFEVFSFDFATATPEPAQLRIDTLATAAGVAGAVLFWFELQLDADTWLSNAPHAEPSHHWGQALQYLPEMNVMPDMPLPLLARHQGSGISFAWHEPELPQRAFSRIPRADPATFAQSMELEGQTSQLMQFSRGNPGEYARLAELALRIAVDPAAYRVDPRVAQRFAAMFI